jgi:hypothetical protein
MESILIHPRTTQQVKIFENLAAELGISFERKKKESPYNKDFVKKIKKNENDFKEGRFVSVKKEDIDTFIDSL